VTSSIKAVLFEPVVKAVTLKEARLLAVISVAALVMPGVNALKLIASLSLTATVSSFEQEARARPATARINRFFFIIVIIVFVYSFCYFYCSEEVVVRWESHPYGCKYTINI
jgi:hypothetical protein